MLDIFTTEGIRLSAKSANESGTVLLLANETGKPIKIRTSGGSIPISPFVSTLNIPALTYPSVNKDNNQHSPNENIKIGNFIDGTLGMTYLLLEEIN